MLTAVLAILTGGGFGRRCQVTVGNKEICLEDVEALEFLWKKESIQRRWMDMMMTESEKQIFVSAEFLLC